MKVLNSDKFQGCLYLFSQVFKWGEDVIARFIQSSYWCAVLEQLKVSISFLVLLLVSDAPSVLKPRNLPQWSILSADDRMIKNPVNAESIKVELLIRTPTKPSKITKINSKLSRILISFWFGKAIFRKIQIQKNSKFHSTHNFPSEKPLYDSKSRKIYFSEFLVNTGRFAWRRGRYRASVNLKDLESLTKYRRLCNSFHNFFSQVKLASNICMWHFHIGRRFITKPSKRLHSIFCIEYQKLFSWHSAFDISNPVFIKCFEFGVTYGPWIPDQFIFWNWIALKSITS